MLLYLIKDLTSNTANMTQQLSKVNDGVNEASFHEVLHVVKYVLDTKIFGLKLEPLGVTPGKLCALKTEFLLEIPSVG